MRSLRLLRVSAAAASAEVLDDYRRLDDLRLAIDELAVAVIRAAPPGERLHVMVRAEADGVHLEGRVRADGDVPALSDVGEMLVATVSRSHHLGRDGADLVFELVIEPGEH